MEKSKPCLQSRRVRMVISATHMTLNESDTSESITWLYFKLVNAHLVCIIQIMHTLQKPMAVLGKWATLVTDIPWQLVLYGLCTTEPEGHGLEGEGYISCTARGWHAICIIYPKGGGACALLDSNRQRIAEQMTRPVNTRPSTSRWQTLLVHLHVPRAVLL